jgi:hypothetical protein
MNVDLIRKLKILKNVSTTSYSLAFKIKDLIKNKKIDVVSYDISDSFYNIRKDLMPIEADKSWITFDNLIFSEFSFFNEKLFCEIVVYNGDNNGFSHGKRFEASVYLPDDFITEIESVIDQNFYYLMKKKYIEHLERERQKWIDENSENYLKKFEIEEGTHIFTEDEE